MSTVRKALSLMPGDVIVTNGDLANTVTAVLVDGDTATIRTNLGTVTCKPDDTFLVLRYESPAARFINGEADSFGLYFGA
jgi:hypothetical protein